MVGNLKLNWVDHSPLDEIAYEYWTWQYNFQYPILFCEIVNYVKVVLLDWGTRVILHTKQLHTIHD
jgi:hypothetical protein